MKLEPNAAYDKLSEKEKLKLFLSPCKTRSQLKKWIKLFTGFDLPDHTVSRFADSNPLDVVWQIYDICVNKNNPEEIEELLFVAARGSGKCVEKGTLTLTKDGFKSIEDVKVGDVVFTGFSYKKVNHTFDEGVKPGVSLYTYKGKKVGAWSLTGSLRHRIQALCPKTGKIDWVFMKDLVPGQIVYRSCESLESQVNVSSEDYEKGWIVGCIVGDGSVSRHDKNISLCSTDSQQLEHYSSLVKRFFNIDTLHKDSDRSENLMSKCIHKKEFREWFHQYIEGDLCYFKKLKTLEHSPSFLAGFISGLMDTDGSKDSICLANPELIDQISKIFSMFGVRVSIDHRRRKPSTTKFVKGHIVEYHEATWSSAMPECLLPRFSKRQVFIDCGKKKNEQFRYPIALLKPFADHIINKYEIYGGYWRLDPDQKKKTHSNIKYSGELRDAIRSSDNCNTIDGHIYRHKLEYFIELAEDLGEFEWASYLRFVIAGHYEYVDRIEFGDHYFYDLEVDKDHSYWSNGFISHNTLAIAIAEFMIMLHDQRDVVHVGAILSQAKRCYEYQFGFYLNDRVKPLLGMKIKDVPIIDKTNIEKSSFNLIDRYSGNKVKVSLEVLPCTLKAVNGPHVPLVSVDEIDTVQGEGLKAFKDISGMLDSRDSRKALRIGISTRKSRYGLMNQQIENAEEAGRTVKSWTTLEFSQKCPDDRSGKKPTVGYILQDEMLVIDEETWSKKSSKNQAEYEKNEFPGEKCLRCPIAALCRGDAKKQESKSNMLKPISDAIKKAKENGADWTISQLFNLKPSVEGIVYKEFDEKLHVKNWNQMWYILTGKEYPGQCTHDDFVKKCFSEDTEVLTNHGFIPFPELKKHHLVASLDDDGKLIYEKPLDYISKHYKGKMISLYNKIGGHGKQLDLLLTPDHQQTYIRRSDIRDGKICIHKKPLSELPSGDYCIPATHLADGYEQEGFSSPISFMTDDQFFAFLGLWLSEGSMSSDRAVKEWRQFNVSVSQYKPEFVDRVAELMRDIKWPCKLSYKRDNDKYNYKNAGRWSLYNRELYTYLRPYKYAVNKAVPREILEKASLRQLSILLDWLMLGDGALYSSDEKQQSYYGTGSKQLADDVQEIAFKLGMRTNLTYKPNIKKELRKNGTLKLDQYRVQIHSKKTAGSEGLRKSWFIKSPSHKSEFGKTSNHFEDIEGYDGMVYCVTMPSGRLFVRRNGVIALSGNCHQMKLSAYAGIDWGWSNPSTLVVFFVDNRENVYVVRTEGQIYTNNPTWVQTIKNKWHHMYGVQLYYPDLANPGDAVTMRQEGLPCPTEQTKDTNGGIQIVKKWLRSLASPVPKMYFAEETCSHIIREFTLYHYKTDAAGNITDDPASEHDHWLDALRYALYELFGKNRMMMAIDDSLQSQNVTDRYGNFNRPPTPEEFAKSRGININTEIDTSKLGKIGTKQELDDDDDGGSAGGFIWSF